MPCRRHPAFGSPLRTCFVLVSAALSISAVLLCVSLVAISQIRGRPLLEIEELLPPNIEELDEEQKAFRLHFFVALIGALNSIPILLAMLWQIFGQRLPLYRSNRDESASQSADEIGESSQSSDDEIGESSQSLEGLLNEILVPWQTSRIFSYLSKLTKSL